MTQPTDTYTSLRRFWLHSLLGHLSCIGVLSLLSNNLVFAQTKIPDAVVVPTKIESKPPSVTAPVVKFAPKIPHVPAPARRERLTNFTPTSVRGERLRQQAPTLPVKREQTKLKVASPPAPRVSPKLRYPTSKEFTWYSVQTLLGTRKKLPTLLQQIITALILTLLSTELVLQAMKHRVQWCYQSVQQGVKPF